MAGANRNAFKLARATLDSIPIARPASPPDPPQGRCLDNGDAYPAVDALVAACGFTAHRRRRGQEAQAITREAGHQARRWVVERTHRWRHRFRRMRIRWEKKPENDLGLLHLVCALITYRAAGLPG